MGEVYRIPPRHVPSCPATQPSTDAELGYLSPVLSAWQVLIYINAFFFFFLLPPDSLETTSREDWVNMDLGLRESSPAKGKLGRQPLSSTPSHAHG